MASPADSKVIAYVADISDVEAKINKLIAGARKVSAAYEKVGQAEIRRLPQDMNNLIGTTTKTSEVIKDANGEFLQLTKTTTIFGRELEKGVVTPFSKTVTSVNNASQSVNSFSKSTSSLMGKTSQLATGFNNINDINQKFAGRLQNVGFATNVVSKNINETSGNIQRMGAIVQTSDGKFVQLQETITKTPTGIQQVSRSVKDVSSSFQEAKTNTVSLGQNIYRLATRAALTIPLWLALRGAVMGVISVFREGIKTIYEQDKTFQKARRNLSATSADAKELAKNFEDLKNASIRLSFESGRSVTEITHAYQRFATIGFDAAASMAGMEGAIKLAVLQQGDGVKTANAFARALRVLINTSDSTKSEADQMNEAFALSDELWKTNSFDVEEYTQNLLKFSATAKGVNLSMKEMLALFATTGTAGLGARAGNLLRTTILKALGEIDKVTQTLNMSFNKETQSTMDFIIEFSRKLEELNVAGTIPYELAHILRELFSIRGTEVGLALATLNEKLRENAAIMGDVNKFNESFKEQAETIGVLSERFTQLNQEIGKNIVQEAFGGAERHRNAFSAIVNYQAQFIKDTSAGVTRMEALGAVIETILRSAAFLPSFLAPILSLGKIGFIDPFAAFTNLKTREFDRAADQVNQFADDIVAGLQGKLSKAELEKLLTDFKIKLKKNNFELADGALIQLEGNLRKQLQTAVDNSSAKVSADLFKPGKRQKQEIAKLILDTEMARLKAIGATNSQMLQGTKILINRLGIEEQTIDKISRQLELERSLSEERRLQSELGNESLKLFKIAQTEGVDVAKQIGDVLSGVTSFDTFMRADTFADAAEIFKKEFSDIFEQQQAKRFFQGLTIPGLEDLRGGYGINIQEEAIRSRGFSAVPAQLMQERAERQFQQLERDKPIVVNAPVSSNINVDISKLSELEQEFLAKVSAELPRLGTELNSALQLAMKNTLVGKQSPTV